MLVYISGDPLVLYKKTPHPFQKSPVAPGESAQTGSPCSAMSTFGHQLTPQSKFAMTREQRHENGPGLSALSRTGNSKGYFKRNGEYIAVPFSTHSKPERSGSAGKLNRCEGSEGAARSSLAGRGTVLRACGLVAADARLPACPGGEGEVCPGEVRWRGRRAWCRVLPEFHRMPCLGRLFTAWRALLGRQSRCIRGHVADPPPHTRTPAAHTWSRSSTRARRRSG